MNDWAVALVAAVFLVCFVIYCSYIIVWAFP
jgi:hypothetical protein